MYRIYFNNKPLYLVSQVSKEIEEYLHHDDTVFIDDFNSHTVKAMIHEMESPKIARGVFLYEEPDAVLKALKKKLTLIIAAGGFVHTADNHVLLILRKGKWDLPKGKLDDNEDLEHCAIREIEEETGIQATVQQPLCITYHTYHQFGKHILKESHWYLMQAEKGENFLPQLEEDIEKCEWVAIDVLDFYLTNTHASIVDVATAGVNRLHQAKNV